MNGRELYKSDYDFLVCCGFFFILGKIYVVDIDGYVKEVVFGVEFWGFGLFVLL